MGFPPCGLVIALGERDELLGHALSLLCLGVGGVDVFVSDEGCNEAAQQGLAGGRVAAQVPVLDEAAGHCEVW